MERRTFILLFSLFILITVLRAQRQRRMKPERLTESGQLRQMLMPMPMQNGDSQQCSLYCSWDGLDWRIFDYWYYDYSDDDSGNFSCTVMCKPGIFTVTTPSTMTTTTPQPMQPTTGVMPTTTAAQAAALPPGFPLMLPPQG